MIQGLARWAHSEQVVQTMEVLTVEALTEMVEVGLTGLEERTSLLDLCNGLRNRPCQCVVVDRKISNTFKIYSRRSIRTSSRRAATHWAS